MLDHVSFSSYHLVCRRTAAPEAARPAVIHYWLSFVVLAASNVAVTLRNSVEIGNISLLL